MNAQLAESLKNLSTEIGVMMGRVTGPPVACREGCFACCDEPVYVTREEARLLVDAVRAQGPEAVEALRAKVKAWMRKFMLTDEWDADMPPVVQYRSLRLTCPLLIDGRCSVYDHRPMGCRLHIMQGSSKPCEDLTQRSRAKYVEVLDTAHTFGHQNVIFAMNEATQASADPEHGHFVIDNLVVLVAEALGMEAPESGSRQKYPSFAEVRKRQREESRS